MPAPHSVTPRAQQPGRAARGSTARAPLAELPALAEVPMARATVKRLRAGVVLGAGRSIDARQLKERLTPEGKKTAGLANNGNWAKITALATDEYELRIDGDIGENWWGEQSNTASRVIKELDGLNATAVTVAIDSDGGAVDDAVGIYNALIRLRNKGVTVNTRIDRRAYSCGSLIAMAGEQIEMPANALMMLHAPWGYIGGNAGELRAYADVLDTYSASILPCYTVRTTLDSSAVNGWLTDGKDHFFTADECLENGLCDVVSQGVQSGEPADSQAMAALRSDATELPNDIQQRIAASQRKHNPQAAPAVPAAMKPELTPETQPKPAAAAVPAPETTDMLSPEQQAAHDAALKAAKAAGGVEALATEKTRREAIAAKFAPFAQHKGMPELETECLADSDCNVQAAGDKLIAHMAKGATPVAAHVTVGDDANTRRRTGITNALLARAGLQADDTANEYRGHTLLEVARGSLANNGQSLKGRGKMDIVAAAFTHSTDDFQHILTNVAEKSMLKGHAEAEETFQKWTATGELGDFKPTRRVDLNSFPALDVVPEGAEYHYGTVGDRGETTQLATYGKLFSITRQAIINDDLDVFSRVPRIMGRAAIRTVGNLVYAVLTANQTMSDGKTLFHATHKNMVTGGAPSTEAISQMMANMRLQKDADGTALNLRLAYVLCPVALEGRLLSVANDEKAVNATGDSNSTLSNIVRSRFEVISDARLDEDSPTAFYGAASPNLHDTIEVSYLDGVSTPTLEQQGGWAVDGVEFKVRLDAGVKALDWRTLNKNPGA